MAAGYGADTSDQPPARATLRAALRARCPDGADAVVDPVGGELVRARTARAAPRRAVRHRRLRLRRHPPHSAQPGAGQGDSGPRVSSSRMCRPTSSRATRTNCANSSVSGRVRPHIGAVYPLRETAARAAARRRRPSDRQGAHRPQLTPSERSERARLNWQESDRSAATDGHHPAAERLGVADGGAVRIVRRGERLGLERAGGRAQLVLHRADGARRAPRAAARPTASPRSRPVRAR